MSLKLVIWEWDYDYVEDGLVVEKRVLIKSGKHGFVAWESGEWDDE